MTITDQVYSGHSEQEILDPSQITSDFVESKILSTLEGYHKRQESSYHEKY